MNSKNVCLCNAFMLFNLATLLDLSNNYNLVCRKRGLVMQTLTHPRVNNNLIT